MKNQFIKSVGILGFSGICAKSFDFLFRAYYSRFLGAEGMGLLALGFGLHSVMLTVATAGLGVAISKIVSENLQKKDYGAIHKSMNLAFFGVTTLSLLIILIIFIFPEQIAKNILSDIRISTGLCCLVPSILFMGISYCLKGFFYASRQVVYPALSEFLEQAVKFVSITLLLKYLLPKGIDYGCSAVFLGITIGEFSSCLFLSLFYLKKSKSFSAYETTQKTLLPSILKISTPSMATSFIGSTLRMQEEVWIITALKQFGMTQSLAMSSFGLIYGMVMPMLVFPLTLIGSVTTLIVPEIARRNTISSKKSLKHFVKNIFVLGISLGMIVMVIFELFPHTLSRTIYDRTDIVPTIKILATLSPIMFLDSLSCSILNGMGKQFSIMLYSLTDSALRIIGIMLFLPQFGIKALVVIIFISNIYTFSLGIRKVIKELSFKK